MERKSSSEKDRSRDMKINTVWDEREPQKYGALRNLDGPWEKRSTNRNKSRKEYFQIGFKRNSVGPCRVQKYLDGPCQSSFVNFML
jgi:hypothetical protein